MLLTNGYNLAGYHLRNRICVPPMVVWAATEEGLVTDYVLSHYRALRGSGMVIVEATAISPEGRLARRQLSAYSEEHLPGLSSLAATIAANGALPGIQIHHAGRSTNRENTFGLDLVAPSSVTSGKDAPLALSVEGIANLVDKYAAAAERAARAGFKLIEIHGAHGYLISQFLSPLANERTDEYGGSLENRMRFAKEVLAKVKGLVAKRALVSMRLGVVDGSGQGLTLAEGVKVAQTLAEHGIDLLHISSGIGGIPDGIRPPESPHSTIMHLAKAVKERVSIPIIGVGGVRTVDQAEQALQDKMADLVAVGKGHLADPLWSEKACLDPESISLCQGCKPCGHWRHPFTCPARNNG